MSCGIFWGVKGVRVACLSEERKVKSEKSICQRSTCYENEKQAVSASKK